MSASRGVLVCCALLWALPVSAQERAAGSGRGRAPEPEYTEEGMFYTVVDGDTLSEIAERFEVTVDRLVALNEGLDPDRLRLGQRLTIDSGLRRVEHEVRSGEALSRIAARYEVQIADLLRWNRIRSRDLVRAGRTLVVFTPVPASRSQSMGSPQHGRLAEGRRMPLNHPAIWVRAPGRAWGTDETVRWLTEAIEAVREDIPNTPRVAVHDLSRRRGGPLMGHHSHRSGRDADVAYYQRSCGGEGCRFRTIGPDQLDVERTWRLFRYWLERDQVDAIFVDHHLQRALYEHAREQGVSPRDLSRWFQYPHPPGTRYGVIRHHPRHANHFHVRFVCHETDEECR